jgi:hypothetical protein
MQTGIIPSARSGSVSSESRWSTQPSSTRVRQVPQKPCRQEYGGAPDPGLFVLEPAWSHDGTSSPDCAQL